MKPKTLTLLLAFLTFLPAFSQKQKKNDWAKENLLGKVKSIEMTNFKGVEKFGEVVKDKKESRKNIEFTDVGYIKLQVLDDGEEKETKTFKYNEKNLVVEETEASGNNRYVVRYSYDAAGNETEVNAYDKKGKLLVKQKSKYNPVGSITRSDYYNGDGKLIKTEEYDYCLSWVAGYWKKLVNVITKEEEHWLIYSNFDDKPGKEINFTGEAVRTEFNLDMEFNDSILMPGSFCDVTPKIPKSTMVSKTEYLYNAKGDVTKKTTSMYRDPVKPLGETSTLYEYDSRGNLVLEKKSNTYYTSYKYTFDAEGNWIKRIRTENAYGQIYHQVTERTIKYY